MNKPNLLSMTMHLVVFVTLFLTLIFISPIHADEAALTIDKGRVGVGLGSVTPSANLHVKGDTILEGPTSVNGTLNVSSHVEISGDLDMNSRKITEVGDPVLDSDAVNKLYVDLKILGLKLEDLKRTMPKFWPVSDPCPTGRPSAIGSYRTYGMIGMGDDFICWGDTSYGALGIYPTGSETHTSFPIINEKNKFSLIKQVEMGFIDTHIVDTAGFVYHAGANRTGLRGDGTVTPGYTFKKITGLVGIIDIFSPVSQWHGFEEDYAYFRSTTNDIYFLGNSTYGVGGIGSDQNISIPIKLSKKFTYISASSGGTQSTIGIDESGYAFTWGRNFFGEVGANNKTVWNDSNHTFVPFNTERLADEVLSVGSTGDTWSGVVNFIRKGNNIYSAGGCSGYPAMLGRNLRTGGVFPTFELLGESGVSYINEPIKYLVADIVRDARISIAAVCTTGSVYFWGDNAWGQLGKGDQGDPTHAYIPFKSNITDVRDAVPLYGAWALIRNDGSVYTAGKNTLNGQSDPNIHQSTFKMIFPYGVKKIVKFGHNDEVAIFAEMENSTVYGWGWSAYSPFMNARTDDGHRYGPVLVRF